MALTDERGTKFGSGRFVGRDFTQRKRLEVPGGRVNGPRGCLGARTGL